jgi:hypothetical protein
VPPRAIQIYGHQFGVAASRNDRKVRSDRTLTGRKSIHINSERMYGLPQAGILTNELLQRNLAKDGYRPTTHTHGFWTHDTRPISFSLVVDDFGVKYAGREHAEHLMACIRKNITFPETGMEVPTVA